MSEKKIEPTDAMVTVAAHALCIDATGMSLYFMHDPAKHPYGNRARIALRAALNHPDAAALFECDHTDYVHVDEAATRVEAAHEEGWDDAVVHIYNKGWEGVTALRKANPYRPAQELPTKPGAVIVPANGREFLETFAGRVDKLVHLSGKWYGGSFPLRPEQITPGTWKVEGE